MRTDTFKIILEILRAIERQLDKPVIDWSEFSAEALGCSEPRWARVMEMLTDEGYIKGFVCRWTEIGQVRFRAAGVVVTLKGLEYLESKE